MQPCSIGSDLIARPRVWVLAVVLSACTPEASLAPASVAPTQLPVSPSPTQPGPSAAPTATPDATHAPIEPRASACGDVINVTAVVEASASARAVLSGPEGLVVYDVPTDSTEVFSAPEDTHSPGFRTSRQVSFVRQREDSDPTLTWGQDALYELDLGTGATTELLRFPDGLIAYDWSPNGRRLAYVVRGEKTSAVGASLLCMFDSGRGRVSLLRSLEYPVGRGGHQRDERVVAWSRNGDHILVVDTGNTPSLWVVYPNGANAIAPREGTFGRWLTSERILFQEGSGGIPEPASWRELTVRGDETRVLALPGKAFRPALSPDGSLLAFDDGRKVPAVYVVDLDGGTTRLLARGFAAPVWLDSDVLALTKAGPCPRTYFCVSPWISLGSIVGVDPANGERRRLAFPSTEDGVLRSAVSDVFLP